jgi:hypothetical protein
MGKPRFSLTKVSIAVNCASNSAEISVVWAKAGMMMKMMRMKNIPNFFMMKTPYVL